MAGAPRQALLTAASRDDPAGVWAALAAGAAIDAATTTADRSAVRSQRGDRDLALHLIDAGADINAEATNHDTPWLLSGALGRAELLAAMLDTGKVDYAKRNRYGGNALIPACERGMSRPCACCSTAPGSTSTTSTISAGPPSWKR